MSDVAIGGRLSSVAKFVRQGAMFADVGTDHAYLPVFLLIRGVIDRAVCSDINAGPLANARATAAEYGVYEKIDFVLTDGAGELSDFGITDMAIAGMGGELIAEIIEGAPFLMRGGVRLVLQPMTKQEHLRRYLYEHGFSLVGEDYVCEGDKSYLILAAEYTGHVPTSPAGREVTLGTLCRGALSGQYNYLTSKLKSKLSAYEGLLRGGRCDGELMEDISYIKGLLSEISRSKL